ncbi:MAG TPA: hypothetical protein VMP10_01225 [Chloroflexota bacterium]|nr:hypothetical protein [Chloroflexota bacterium]
MHLEVYVAAGCLGCDEAYAIARIVQEHFPTVHVDVIHLDDLDRRGRVAPTSVVAVPTYLLDGEVISLGNPRRDDLIARLAVEQGGRS